MEETFFERVYSFVREIPKGRVCTYGLVAKYIGSPGAAKMVGWALNKCSNAKEYVPAHRVVNSKGILSAKQHFGGSSMQQLLQNEGINISNDKIIDFKTVLWDPGDEY